MSLVNDGQKINDYRIIIGSNIEIETYQASKGIIKKYSDVIHLKYKMPEREKKVKAFGKEFVKNNKNKCYIIYQNKKHELCVNINICKYKKKDIKIQ